MDRLSDKWRRKQAICGQFLFLNFVGRHLIGDDICAVKMAAKKQALVAFFGLPNVRHKDEGENWHAQVKVNKTTIERIGS